MGEIDITGLSSLVFIRDFVFLFPLYYLTSACAFFLLSASHTSRRGVQHEKKKKPLPRRLLADLLWKFQA